MAAVETLLLCSAASARYGLLSVLDAGIDEFRVEGYPSDLAPVLVVNLREEPDDHELPVHAVDIEVLHRDSEERLALVTLNIRFEGPRDPDPDFARGVTIVQALQLQMRRDGVYRILVRVDGLLKAAKPLRITSTFPSM